MATRTAVVTDVEIFRANATLNVWSGLLNGDVGNAFELLSGIATVHIKGTFGSGGSVTLKGSNDGVTWIALTDPQGNAITKTAEAMEALSEMPRYVRPEVTAGDGSTDLAVHLLVRRPI